ncbi:hypothetical protein KAFR_0E02850 [Kazachstania africana CBS 2517]|uniref:non-specific serine/threonine protein kinase n=1 Tax=Kazachstania africana (strain ATCC 22294 / BCRC 22015 / CBS 2517 / CECT 1963 / NBRC 1671 / NRRL Y-8276) TaxID=1071382 RepID=H2AVN7_KAZAF|nr:hypothetical protein KAFR_0E02850 [Kazachstania africana CBS 2517]CCF58437.1 hypothetical protein KAFR_0E02850 [Kazachstania africana CBS 2517]
MFTNYQVNNFKILEEVGSGAYGLVFHVIDTITFSDFAMKVIIKSRIDCTEDRRDLLTIELLKCFNKYGDDYLDNKIFLPAIDLHSIKSLTPEQLEHIPHYKEISLQLKVHAHKNVVTIHQVLESELATFIIMDYYPVDLFTAIVDQERFIMDGLLVKQVFLQLCSAIAYCHKLNVYHCDIKPENLLLDNDDNLVICDFGLATTSKYLVPNVSVGSSYYMAPERILSINNTNKFLTMNSDIWSLGIILINLVCIRNPWLKAHQTGDSTFSYFMRDQSILMKILPISDELFEVINSILQINPKNRVSIIEIMKKVSMVKNFTREGPLTDVPLMDENVFFNCFAAPVDEVSPCFAQQRLDDSDATTLFASSSSSNIHLSEFITTKQKTITNAYTASSSTSLDTTPFVSDVENCNKQYFPIQEKLSFL